MSYESVTFFNQFKKINKSAWFVRPFKKSKREILVNTIFCSSDFSFNSNRPKKHCTPSTSFNSEIRMDEEIKSSFLVNTLDSNEDNLKKD